MCAGEGLASFGEFWTKFWVLGGREGGRGRWERGGTEEEERKDASSRARELT